MTNESGGARQRLPAAPWPGGSEAILLVEDDPGLRSLFSEVLRKCGYQVSIAANGSEALAAVHGRVGCFALVVSDVVMPGITGLELANDETAQ